MAIFLSYRRGSTEHAVGRIFDRIRERFPGQDVFYDIDNIPLGIDFANHLINWVEKSDLFVVVIGPDWDVGRLHQEDDFVRIEIEAALRKGIPVIPVLVNGVETVPAPDTLPEVLAPLSFRQGLRVGSGVDFSGHVEILLRGLEAHLVAGPEAPTPGEPLSDDTNVLATEQLESDHKSLLRSAMVERNLLWTSGILTLGVYYYFAGAFLFREAGRLLQPESGIGALPALGRGHRWFWIVGLAVGLLAWGVGVFYLWLVTFQVAPLYERYIVPTFFVTAGLLWVSASIVLGWLWSGARTLGGRRQALARAAQRIPRAWMADEGGLEFDPTSQLLRKVLMFVLFFPVFMYVAGGLQASLIEGVATGTIRVENLYLHVVLMMAVCFLALFAGTQLCGELFTEFLQPTSEPLGPWRRIMGASWFLPSMLLNLVAGGWGYYLAHRGMLDAIFGF